MPKPQGEHPKLTLKDVVRVAQDVALNQGGHTPMLVVEGRRNTMGYQVPEMVDSHEGRTQQFFMIGLMLASVAEIGVLQQVFFISEGWMSVVEEGKEIDRPPSEDPQRQEVLMIYGLSVATRKAQMQLFEMRRDEKGDLKSLEAPKGSLNVQETQVESPLLNAFALGFLGAGQEADG